MWRDILRLRKVRINMAKCKSCGAYIEWVKTVNGKNMPVDEKLHYYSPAGRLITYGVRKYVTVNGEVRTGLRLNMDDNTEGAELGYTPHWSTCPSADKHRAAK
jgi:hypothetical protein